MPISLPSLRTEHDRDIARLAVPAFGTLIAEPLYVLADTAIVGHLGTTQLAGLALASTVLLTIHALMIFLAYGATGRVARLLGAGESKAAAERSLQGLWLAVILGTGTMVALWLTGPALIGVLGGDNPTVAAAAERYLSISAWGVPSMLVLLAANGSFHGRQNTRLPLVLAVSGALINLVIEMVLIIGLEYGIGASALATVIAQTLTALVAAALLVPWARRTGASVAPDPVEMMSALRAGSALVLRTAALRGSFTLSVAVAARIGVAAVAAHQIALQVWGLLALALDAVAIAGQSLTGTHLGRGDANQARSSARRMIEIDIAVGAAFGLILFVFRGPIAGIFSSDPDVVGVAGFLFAHVAAQQPLGGLVFALDGILIGAGDLAYLARTMLLAAAGFALLAGVVATTDAGIGWLWAAIAVFMGLRAIGLWWRWRGADWLVLGT